MCDGEVKLVRTKQSNQIWQVRIWVRGEGRYFRKSLRTRDLEKAKEKAKSIFYKMMGQVEIGARIFSISIKKISFPLIILLILSKFVFFFINSL